MNVPGAESSGFCLPSSVGPRLENAAIPSELLAALSPLSGLLEYPHPDQVAEIVGLSFSDAPMVNTFFAVAGAPILSASISPSEFTSSPLLPAENKISIPVWFHDEKSACMDLAEYSP